MLGYLLSPVLQIEDTNGRPLVNGKLYVYEANTSNLATIYSNYEGTLNTNPAILDLVGHTTIIADDIMMYDITVKDKDDNLLFSAKDVAVGGEGGSASVSDVTVRAGGNGITVVQSVENNTKVFTVSIDYNFVASKTDLNAKQNVLTPGDNISISGDTISVTGLKTINVTAPLQKTETTSAINLSIDTSGIQTTLSAGTNIDEVKLSNNIVDLKSVDCSASTYSIAIGRENLASGNCSFAEGQNTSAVGYYSHSEGMHTLANADGSHAEGDRSKSIGLYSHAEGSLTSAIGDRSHSEGQWTIASGDYQTVIGKYNAPNTTDLFQIGCGSADNARQNALEVKSDNTIVVGPSSIKLAASAATAHFSADAGGNTFLYAKYQSSHKNGDSIKNSIIMGPAYNFTSTAASSKFDDCIFMGRAYMFSPNASSTYSYEGNTLIGYNSISNADDSSENNTIIGRYNDFLGHDNDGSSAHKFRNNTVIGYQNNSYTDSNNVTVIGCNNDVGNTSQGTPNNKEVYALTIVGYGNDYKYVPSGASPQYGLMLGNYNGITNSGNYKTVTIGFDNALTGNCTYLIGDSLSATNEGSYSDKIMKIGFGDCHLEIHSSGTIYKVVNGTKTQL